MLVSALNLKPYIMDLFRPYIKDPILIRSVNLTELGEEISYVIKQSQGEPNEFGETPFSKEQVTVRAKAYCSTPFTGTGEYQYQVDGNVVVGVDYHVSSKSTNPRFKYLYNENHCNLKYRILAVVWEPNSACSCLNFTVGIVGTNRRTTKIVYIEDQTGVHIPADNMRDRFIWFRNWCNSRTQWGNVEVSATARVEKATVLKNHIPDAWKNAYYASNICQSAFVNCSSARWRNEIYGTSLLAAVDNCQATDVVNIENAVQLVETLRQPSQLLPNIAHLSKQNPLKTAANLKLSYDYSVKTTIRDLQDLASAALAQHREVNIARGRASDTASGQYGNYTVDVFEEHAWKIFYGSCDESLIPFYRILQEIGADPSFEHVWNVIPYSFVVDWFLPTQKLLKEMDYDTNVSTLPLRACTHGDWVKLHLDDGSISVDYSTYIRETVRELPPFPYFLPSITPDVNWWNGAALLVQRIVK